MEEYNPEVWLRLKDRHPSFEDITEPLTCLEEDGVYQIEWEGIYCIVDAYMLVYERPIRKIVPSAEFTNIEHGCDYLKHRFNK